MGIWLVGQGSYVLLCTLFIYAQYHLCIHWWPHVNQAMGSGLLMTFWWAVSYQWLPPLVIGHWYLNQYMIVAIAELLTTNRWPGKVERVNTCSAFTEYLLLHSESTNIKTTDISLSTNGYGQTCYIQPQTSAKPPQSYQWQAKGTLGAENHKLWPLWLKARLPAVVLLCAAMCDHRSEGDRDGQRWVRGRGLVCVCETKERFTIQAVDSFMLSSARMGLYLLRSGSWMSCFAWIHRWLMLCWLMQ